MRTTLLMLLLTIMDLLSNGKSSSDPRSILVTRLRPPLRTRSFLPMKFATVMRLRIRSLKMRMTLMMILLTIMDLLSNGKFSLDPRLMLETRLRLLLRTKRFHLMKFVTEMRLRIRNLKMRTTLMMILLMIMDSLSNGSFSSRRRTWDLKIE